MKQSDGRQKRTWGKSFREDVQKGANALWRTQLSRETEVELSPIVSNLGTTAL